MRISFYILLMYLFILSSGFVMNLSNNQNSNNIKRLENIKSKITNYVKETKDTNKLEKGRVSTFQAIPKVSFDNIFMNINNISKIYMSYNVDRIIFEMTFGKRLLFYIKDKEDKERIDMLIRLIPNQLKCIIITDVKNTMDDVFGYLYCSPKDE